jgi:ADP-ribose pyrophosphatase YjhB (NUDIX family)
MEKLFEIVDKDIGEKPKEVFYWDTRSAARLIILENDKIATLHIKKWKFHTLIGGGIEHGESLIQAATREAMEEAGCIVKIIDKLATTIEVKTHISGRQRSTFFIAEVINKTDINLTEEEKGTESTVEWMTLTEAIKTMKAELKQVKEYEKKFSLKRNITVLEFYKELIQKA